MKIIEVPLPYMTNVNKHNRIYDKELTIGNNVPVLWGVPDTPATPLKDVLGMGEVIEDNQLRIKFIKEQEELCSKLISGELVVVPRGMGETRKEDHLVYIANYTLIDFNIIPQHRSSFR